jgi:nucleoside-diphosphate-sugar epimerase
VTPKPIEQSDLQHVLEGTSLLWEEMRNQQLFITGGTGFFGCWLLESFCYINHKLGLNARVKVLTRSSTAFARKAPHIASDASVSFLDGNVRDFRFPEGDFRFVIHAATDVSAGQKTSASLELLGSIFLGTQRTLEFAASHGTSRFLLASSGAVYGAQPSTISYLPETYKGAPDPLDPRSAYSEGKRAAELMCALFHQTAGIECAIARCWAFCGPYLPLDGQFAIGNFIGDVLAGRPIHIKGDGTARRSYLYGADLAVWLWTMLFRAPSLIPINVGSPTEVSMLELARIVAATLNPETEICVAERTSPNADISRYVPCVDRAKELLGLSETVGLRESIRRTALWNGGSAIKRNDSSANESF